MCAMSTELFHTIVVRLQGEKDGLGRWGWEFVSDFEHSGHGIAMGPRRICTGKVLRYLRTLIGKAAIDPRFPHSLA